MFFLVRVDLFGKRSVGRRAFSTKRESREFSGLGSQLGSTPRQDGLVVRVSSAYQISILILTQK